jgi:hypothetical protein
MSNVLKGLKSVTLLYSIANNILLITQSRAKWDQTFKDWRRYITGCLII